MTLNDKITSYEPMIYSIINQLNILYDKDEYMQIGRIAVYEAVKKFDPAKASCSESRFVYTIIRQRLIDEIRKVSRQQERYGTSSGTPDTHPSTDDTYNLENNSLRILNEREYRWLTLTLSGYTLAEISIQLGVSPSTVKNIRRNARDKLRGSFTP
ncbi:RNA polymerase sigma factor SigS [Jeotgalicoccus saudimassiliensis]|uniref:RNA polymerase sigma factor SigS n=1 Tax=Jeotgalicoccus saudimassiliensis TaxID=1461582 RepID=A0A078LVL1_9STAP|nr:sigma-70 family RNA polymerase sigma factor [Jeotgalicoccus saudimassiliensis]CDZ99223.1 RNA polymerase sigma factor SigS [Jeotgalicoccus saudimassiliensis]